MFRGTPSLDSALLFEFFLYVMWRMIKPLYDSEGRLESLQVVMLCRDNADYLRAILPLLEGLEKQLQVPLEFLFIENDSRDETLSFLKAFVQRVKGFVLSPKLPEDFAEKARTERLAHLRNLVHQHVSVNARWIVLIDTNVYFDATVIQELFLLAQAYPETGLLGAHGLEVIKRRTLRGFRKSLGSSFRQVQTGSGQEFLTQHHYYDSYAYRDAAGKSSWPSCTFTSCRKCNDSNTVGHEHEGVRWVQSCFGGLALIRSNLLTHYQARWKGFSSQGEEQCEHLGFCDDILEHTPYKVGIAVNRFVYWVCR